MRKKQRSKRNPDQGNIIKGSKGLRDVSIATINFISLNRVLANIKELTATDIQTINSYISCFCGKKNMSPKLAIFTKEQINQFLIDVGIRLDKVWLVLLRISEITGNKPIFIGV